MAVTRCAVRAGGMLAAAAMLTFTEPASAQEPQQGAVMRVWSMFFYNSQWDFIGLLIVWTLLLLSALCMGFALHLIMRFRRSMVLPEGTHAQLRQMLQAGQYREAIDFAEIDPSYLGKIVSSALHQASNGYAAMERAIEETGDAETTRYLRPIEYLNVVGNIAPMMGLFGTVYGMIVAFQSLVEAGGRPDPVQLAGGISTALVTTFWGLVVAIPSMAAYALVRNKVDALTSEGLLLAEELLAPFKPAAKKPGVTPGTAPPAKATR
jgi:biopolymer transport protein ExbB